MKRSAPYRFLQLFVIFGLPALGWLYAYQYTGQSRVEEIPFRVFQAPSDPAFLGDGVTPQNIQLEKAITVINFWASWCPPCVEEFPAMMQLRHILAQKGVDFVFVSVDDDWSKVVEFQKNYNIKLPPTKNLWDKNKVLAKKWGSQKFPETFVVTQDGWVVEKIIGAQTWTRQGVVDYFIELGKKFSRPQISSHNFFINSSWAQEALPLHEKDRKTLEVQRKNVEIAGQNVQKAEAALKEEQRNLDEQEELLKRKKREEREADEDFKKLQSKFSESERNDLKLKKDKSDEEFQRTKIEAKLKRLEEDIQRLKKELEAKQDERQQTQKELDKSVQKLVVVDESLESSKTDLETLKGRVTKSKSNYDEKALELKRAEEELGRRKSKLLEIKGLLQKSQESYRLEKSKLESFEKALQK